ncbi:MAG: hypothetical protein WAM13_10640 [Candidatus Sulfotelmatobacter sp.]|jgi:hypothetical protein
MRLLTVFGLFIALSPYATAQRAAHAITPHSATPHLNSATGSFAFGRAAYASRFRRPFPYTSLPFPFFADSFNPDDLYSTGYPVASQPPVILLQAARALAGPAEAGPAEYADREPSPAQPLMIELQNGHYVRVNRVASDDEALPLTLAPDRTPSPPSELAPVLLVFRDGHNEEVRNYTIADGILYASGDYYTDGYWNKKIALSTINVPQTLEANAKRDVKFVLPESPNEVITRP